MTTYNIHEILSSSRFIRHIYTKNSTHLFALDTKTDEEYVIKIDDMKHESTEIRHLKIFEVEQRIMIFMADSHLISSINNVNFTKVYNNGKVNISNFCKLVQSHIHNNIERETEALDIFKKEIISMLLLNKSKTLVNHLINIPNYYETVHDTY